MKTFKSLILIIISLGAGACAVLGDFASDDPGFAERPGVFEGRFLAVSDADMTATAYADGRLEPFSGGRDEIALFEAGALLSAEPASNSVISWPQIVDVSDDGRFAFVIETRAPAPAGVSEMQDVFTDFPQGSALTVFSIENDRIIEVDRREGVGLNPQSVDYIDEGQLVIGSEDDNAELVFVRIDDDGSVADINTYDLVIDYREDDTRKWIRTVHASPNGDLLAVNIADKRIQFYRVFYDDSGVVTGISPFGLAAENLGRRLAVGKWSPDGQFFLVTDVNWPDSTIGMLTQGPGAITVLKPPADEASPPTLVSRAKVGRSPEGFSFSPSGAYVASINMERTYLPNSPPLAFWQGRRRYSVSLLSFDSNTGALAEIDRVYAAGVLPEDVIFDETETNLAVATYHRRKGGDRLKGFIDFFSIENRELVAQGATQPVMRGAHDLVLVP